MSAIATAQAIFPGRLGIVQRVLPPYRVPVFDLLADSCARGLSVFAGKPAKGEPLPITDRLDRAVYAPARNAHIFSGRFYLCHQRGWREWLEQWQPDVVIMEANPRYISTRLARKWMHKRNRPVMGWGLGVMPLSTGLEGLRSAGRTRFIRGFDGMIAYSSRAAAQYVDLGIPADRVFVCTNAAARRPTNAMPARPDHWVDGRPTVLFVGVIKEGKRLDVLIKACAALGSDINPRLRVVGDGPDLDDMKAIAAKVYPETAFLGAMRGAALAEQFAAADLFVLPGLGGLAIQEAMAHGLPVIVAEGDGTQDDLVRSEPRNGWNVPPGDVDALVETMRDALSDPARLRRIGAESYRIVTEEINVEKMVEVIVRGANVVRNAKRASSGAGTDARSAT